MDVVYCLLSSIVYYINREYYMALSISHPVSGMILVEGWYGMWYGKSHNMFIIYLNMRKSCSVLWTYSHVINIILRGMIKGWWYRYQSRQTNPVVIVFQYYICKFPLFSTKYMINWFISNLLQFPLIFTTG